MTENTEGRPNDSLVYADVSFTDNTGNLLAFGLYKSKEGNDLYLNFPFGKDSDSSKWYKLKNDEMYELFSGIKEKTPS